MTLSKLQQFLDNAAINTLASIGGVSISTYGGGSVHAVAGIYYVVIKVECINATPAMCNRYDQR